MKKFQILSIDGGGLRGVFPAGILGKLEETYETRITDHFDLIVGTSTGGIIALGLGKGLSPTEIQDFYIEKGQKIFEGADGVLKKATQLATTKFESGTLEKELKSCFGATLMGESKNRLVITAYDLENDDVRLFKTAHHPRLRNDHKLPMWQIGLATAAAPTYFSACRAIKDTRLVDGGVWANNPTMVGLTEALSMGIPPESIRILSIGTSWELLNRPKNLDNGGIWDWKGDVVDVMFRGQNHAAIKQAELILRPYGEGRVHRIDFPVPQSTFSIDRVDTSMMLPKIEYQARHHGPTCEKLFFDHQALPFEPCYKPQPQELSYVP